MTPPSSLASASLVDAGTEDEHASQEDAEIRPSAPTQEPRSRPESPRQFSDEGTAGIFTAEPSRAAASGEHRRGYSPLRPTASRFQEKSFLLHSAGDSQIQRPLVQSRLQPHAAELQSQGLLNPAEARAHPSGPEGMIYMTHVQALSWLLQTCPLPKSTRHITNRLTLSVHAALNPAPSTYFNCGHHGPGTDDSPDERKAEDADASAAPCRPSLQSCRPSVISDAGHTPTTIPPSDESTPSVLQAEIVASSSKSHYQTQPQPHDHKRAPTIGGTVRASFFVPLPSCLETTRLVEHCYILNS